MVYISSRKDLLDYCKKKCLNPGGFNEPVTLNSDFNNLFDGKKSCEYLLNDEDYLRHSEYLDDTWDDWDDEDDEDFEYNPVKGHFCDNGKLSRAEREELYDLWSNGLFGGFTSFNSEIIISPEVKNISGLLKGATSFNRALNIPEGVEDVSWLFSDCDSYNQIPTFPSTVTNMQYAFMNCKHFNQCFIIPDGVRNCEGLLVECIRYNQPTSIPSSVENCTYMFEGCVFFFYNQKTIISYGVKDCSHMFEGCDSYNQDTEIPDSVTKTSYMFYGCKTFNSNTNIPSWMIDYSEDLIPPKPGMFANCRSFSEPGRYYKMFYGCDSLDWDKVYIPTKYSDKILASVRSCAYGKSSHAKPIHLPENMPVDMSFPKDAFKCESFNRPIPISKETSDGSLKLNELSGTSLFDGKETSDSLLKFNELSRTSLFDDKD